MKSGNIPKDPLVRGYFKLQKFSGKGGWTYAELPEVSMNRNNPFGWVRVSGTVDDFVLEKYKLMPMGNGHLFLPVKASVRKAIQKEAGDEIYIELFSDERPDEIPQELLACFENEPVYIRDRFDMMDEKLKIRFLDRIFDARSDVEKTKEILKLLQILTINE